MKTTNYNNNMNGYYVPFDACEDVRMFVTLMADDTKSIIRLAQFNINNKLYREKKKVV